MNDVQPVDANLVTWRRPIQPCTYISRIINHYRARHSYQKILQGCKLQLKQNPLPYPPPTHKALSSTSPPFPTGGEWDHPPLRGRPRRPTPPHSKENETSQPRHLYTIKMSSMCWCSQRGGRRSQIQTTSPAQTPLYHPTIPSKCRGLGAHKGGEAIPNPDNFAHYISTTHHSS